MKLVPFFNHSIVRNLLGIIALFAVHFVSDQYHLERRTGFNRWLPYLFLLLLYGWLVFHHRILFDRLFLRGKKKSYWGWLLVALTLCSCNMHYILRVGFGVTRTLPHVVSFWLYTLTGLGVYVIFRYLRPSPFQMPSSADRNQSVPDEAGYFTCVVEGREKLILHADILYIESLENYLKINTPLKVYLTRLTLKQAEERLPKPAFIRISKSHIINTTHLEASTLDTVKVAGNQFRIGKVFKRYVTEQLAAQAKNQ